MVGSAVLGAATGTGLALVVAMTIVVYRYYAYKRYGKEWSDLERFSDSRSSYKKNIGYSITQKVSSKIILFFLLNETLSSSLEENKNEGY